MCSEIERTEKVAFVVYFIELFKHSPSRPEENCNEPYVCQYFHSYRKIRTHVCGLVGI
jgi:hypothetical protein